MKLAQLKRPADADHTVVTIAGTHGQDTPLDGSAQARRRRLSLYGAGLLAVLIATSAALLIRAWSHSAYTVSAERLRLATVTRGHFTRDVAAEGTVVAPVSPTLFAIAAGTLSYAVHTGDAVTRGQLLATLDSPELRNEHEREKATLDGQNAALERLQIEIRKQLLTSIQQADLARVTIEAAERELKRNQWAWDLRAIPERDYRRAIDDLSTAKLNFEHARATAQLDRESLALELRTRRLERERQALVVADLGRRVGELSVRSPVSGRVANLAQPDRAHVVDGAPLVTVVDLSALELEFHVAESFAGDIRPGMAAAITLGGRIEPGAVTTIAPEVRDNEVMGRVSFTAGYPPGLRQNERAAVRIVLDEREGVLQFERGSQIDEGTRALYVVRGERAVRVPVQLGAASTTAVEVLTGLAPGERVVISDMRDFGAAPEILIGN